MAFTGLHLTDFGSAVEAKAKALGQPVEFTRVALGDGVIGNGSLTSRTKLISEKMSVLIMDKRYSGNIASVIARVTNSELEEGFYYREHALMCRDPQTGQEGTYAYDNCREAGEYIGNKDNGQKIDYYLRLKTAFTSLEDITFPEFENPVYVLADEYDEKIAEIESKLVSVDKETISALDAHKTDGTAHTGLFVPPSEKGVAGGVATLDMGGKVPASQLPSMNYDTAGSAAAVQTALDTHKTDSAAHSTLFNAKVPTTRTINGKALAANITLSATDVGADPTGSASAALTSAKTYTDDLAAERALYTATITTSWTTATTGYSQTITVSGVLATDTPIIGVVQTFTVATNQTLLKNWALVSRITTAANSITVYAYGEKPTTAIPIQILCVR